MFVNLCVSLSLCVYVSVCVCVCESVCVCLCVCVILELNHGESWITLHTLPAHGRGTAAPAGMPILICLQGNLHYVITAGLCRAH